MNKKLKRIEDFPGVVILANEEGVMTKEKMNDLVRQFVHSGMPTTSNFSEWLDLLATPFEEIRGLIGRSGYGKDGNGEFREAKLKDMSDAWVRASIDYVGYNHPHKEFYIQELVYRKENNITIEDSE